MPITQPEALPQPVEAMPQRYTILMPTVDTRIYGHHITYMHGDRTSWGSFNSCCHVRRQLREAGRDGSSRPVSHEELEARLLCRNRPARSDLQQDWCAHAPTNYSPSGNPAMSRCMRS